MRRVLLLLVTSCLTTSLPPSGEARIFVDTDLPVPRLCNRLRVDVYSEDGARFIETRDIALADPASWPASFGVVSADPEGARRVIVRLRAYVGGVVRDYRGERFMPRPPPGRPDEIVQPPVAEAERPRLFAGDLDRTPATEPEPSAAIDRLLRVDLTPGVVRTIPVILRGACAGTMADLANARTCVDREDERVSADAFTEGAPLEASARGTFGREAPCAVTPRAPSLAADGTPLFDEEVCVRGGAFLFGSRVDVSNAQLFSARPERIVVQPSFLLDKYEMTVGRARALLAAGVILPNRLFTYDAPLETDGSCTFTSTPMGREAYPLNCVNREQAVAFCRALGGDLPSEVQFEMAASRDLFKQVHPWGDADPECNRAIYGRAVSTDLIGDQSCGKKPLLVQPEDSPDSDVAPSGAVNLAGNLHELMLDSFASLRANCWASQPLFSPVCEGSSKSFTLRGGNWRSPPIDMRIEERGEVYPTTENGVIGFRCARSAR